MSNFSHENCTHASTKAGRAKCRRDRQMIIPTIETPKFVPVAVTRENWREFKTETVHLIVRSDFSDKIHEYVGKITGWSENMIQFKHHQSGKTVRVMASYTDVVETIEN